MKKMLIVLAIIALYSFAANANEVKTAKKISKPALKHSKTKLDQKKKAIFPFVTSCGTEVQYFPPDGESCENTVNAIISLNNAICGTSIPPSGFILCNLGLL